MLLSNQSFRWSCGGLKQNRRRFIILFSAIHSFIQENISDTSFRNSKIGKEHALSLGNTGKKTAFRVRIQCLYNTDGKYETDISLNVLQI
jgi:hypothetical protein